jgi:branched-chain amino acid transport system substrate-binding protein
MRKASVIASALTVLVLCFGVAGCGGGSTAPSVFKIGVVAELTGSIPAVGESCRNGVTLAAKEINDAGGIGLGVRQYKVELVIKDCENDPKVAARVTRELIDKDYVNAIVGPNATANAMAAAAEAEKSGVVLVTPWSTSPKTTLDSKGQPRKYVFRVCVTASYEGNGVAQFSKGSLGASKAAVLYDRTADVVRIQAEDFSKSFKAAGGTVVAYESFKGGDKDSTPQLTKIGGAAPDVLFVPAYYNDVPNLLEQVKAAGITAQVIGNNGWSSPDLIDESGMAIEGAYVFNMYSPESNDPVTQRFVQAYQAAYEGVLPDDVAALSYDAVGLLRKGFESGTSILTSKMISGPLAAFRQALDESLLKVREFPGATGTMRFTAGSRDPVRGAVMLRVENGQFTLVTQL